MKATDIKQQLVPIVFKDKVFIKKLSQTSIHPSKSFNVYVDGDTGELYSAIDEDSTDGTKNDEILSPYNLDMIANITENDGDLACNNGIMKTPKGEVQVYINGLKESIGDDKSCYFSSDGSSTVKTIDQIYIGDKLYWNPSIAGYNLDENDKVTFSYIMNANIEADPYIIATIDGGYWGTLEPGIYNIVPDIYNKAPLESWEYVMNTDNFIKLNTSESSDYLLNIADIKINGNNITKTFYDDITLVSDENKKIIDDSFQAYSYNGVTVTIERGNNWESFTI